MKGVNAKVHIMESGKRGRREDWGKKYSMELVLLVNQFDGILLGSDEG